jgi:hypothetical protein
MSVAPSRIRRVKTISTPRPSSVRPIALEKPFNDDNRNAVLLAFLSIPTIPEELSSFFNGVYQTWEISGHVTIVVRGTTSPIPAIINGSFSIRPYR